MATRRDFLQTASTFGIGAALGFGVSKFRPKHRATLEVAGSGKSSPPAPGVLALSLRCYQRELTAAVRIDGKLPPEIQEMHGLNALQGFTIENNDVILFGKNDPSRPVVALDDFLVALRSAYRAGPEYDAAPGCTIDPKPGAADPWKIQIARVLGMPASAPMGARHLEIDYDLKRVSAGLKQLHTQSIEVRSIFDSKESAAPLCGADETPAAPNSSTHRFWFCPLYPPEQPRFLRDDRTVLVQHPVNVQLLTEEEFLRNGTRVGSAPPQPAAVEFARGVTRLLNTNDIPEYARLRGDFRVIEVGKLLQYCGAGADILTYLLRECQMQAVATPRWLGGIRRSETGEAVCKVQVHEEEGKGNSAPAITQYIRHYRRDYRGGVELTVNVTPGDFGPGEGSSLNRLANTIVRGRPSPDSVSWVVS